MPVPLLLTRLLVPPLRPKAVLRRRLVESLNQGISGKLTLISAPQKAAKFRYQVVGPDFSEADAAALEARAEDWITGLQLAFLSMQRREDLPAFSALSPAATTSCQPVCWKRRSSASRKTSRHIRCTLPSLPACAPRGAKLFSRARCLL